MKRMAQLSAVGIMGFAMSVSALQACELSIGWEPWEPYQYQDDDGSLAGLDVELVRAIGERMECDIEFIEVPWRRHLSEVESGGMDLAAGADRTGEREAYAYFSDPYRSEAVALFVRAGEVEDYPLESLKDIEKHEFYLGTSAGYHYGEEFEQLMESPGFARFVEPVRADENNYRKLKAERLDGFFADNVSLPASVEGTEFEGAFEAHPLTVSDDPIHVMFSKESTSEAMVERFNEALDALRESGEHRRITERYTDL